MIRYQPKPVEPQDPYSIRGVWWLEDRPEYGGPRWDGELWWNATPAAMNAYKMKLIHRKWDAVEIRLHNNQLVRVRMK